MNKYQVSFIFETRALYLDGLLQDGWGMEPSRLLCIYCNIHLNIIQNIDSFDV